MSYLNKSFIGVVAIALSGAVFSAVCPSVGGYTISARNQDNTRCSYTSHDNGTISLQGQRAVHNCPRFILTDPNYRLDGRCQVVMRANQMNIGGQNQRGARCQCTTVTR